MLSLFFFFFKEKVEKKILIYCLLDVFKRLLLQYALTDMYPAFNFSYRLNSIFYLTTIITMTYSAIVASKSSDPSVYDISGLNIVRGIFEIWSVGMALVTLVLEIHQCRKYVEAYNAINVTFL